MEANFQTDRSQLRSEREDVYNIALTIDYNIQNMEFYCNWKYFSVRKSDKGLEGKIETSTTQYSFRTRAC